MFNKEVFIQRRNKLRQHFSEGVLLFTGNTDVPMNYPANTYHFRQDSNFLYFFGLDFPNLAGIIDIESGNDIIFGNDIDIEDIIWMGSQPSMKDLCSQVGISHVKSFSLLSEFLKGVIKNGQKIHFLPPYRAEIKIILEQLLGIHHSVIKDHSSVQLIKSVVSLREIKDKFEIEDIEKCEDIAYEMHVSAMKHTKPGIYESEIAAIIESVPLKYQAYTSFPVICSINGEILHNHFHGNILQDGKLLIADAGAESPMHYATDITRTFPVSGKFSQKQKEIYEIVLNANNRVIEISKPGITYQSVHLEAATIIADGLKALGLMKGETAQIVKNGAHALFFPHGLGHMMGLDVHDMEDLGENYVGYDSETQRINQFGTAYLRLGKKLKPGFVITDEPGIYFIPALIDLWKSEKKFTEFINYDKVDTYRDFGGIRLEDDLLITTSGCRILGKKRIPVTVDEVENIIGIE